jgi:hypothetical protein
MTSHLRRKYEPIPVEKPSIRQILAVLHSPSTTDDMTDLSKPFEEAEIHDAFRSANRRRAPGYDGNVREFYLREWEVIREDMCTIFNQMFFDKRTTPKQNHGVIICLPKVRGGLVPQNYRPITLLNTDYKCLARMLARRLRPVVGKHLTGTPYCGVTGTSVIDAVATIRDVITCAESKRHPMFVLSLDFSNIFDSIAHEYLFHALRVYALPEPFVTGIEHTYGGATSSARVNGQLCGPIPIDCAIRQG